ncbi:F-box/LRR-repeat protein 15 [Trichoplax sp. H2]|nr:F-box/LRR-repeat protein 15 [Trichoplax sp. H2]|eukprot:RDD37718.1 F-box/LRR-repeat protein 15 [Trichoplax sp. H2]
MTLTVFSLPWEDVIFTSILPFLTLMEVCNLRLVCKSFNQLCLEYFTCCTVYDLSPFAASLRHHHLQWLLGYNRFIQYLNVSNCKDLLNDDNFIPILRQNQHLRQLWLSGCSKLTNASIECIATNCPYLTELHLNECRWLSKEIILLLSAHCHQLEVFSCRGCWDIEDECIISLSINCPNLKEIDLACCYAITNKSIFNLAARCHRLRHVSLVSCWRVTDTAIKNLGENCPNLAVLHVADCRNIGEKSLVPLHERGVQLDVPATLRFYINDRSFNHGSALL